LIYESKLLRGEAKPKLTTTPKPLQEKKYKLKFSDLKNDFATRSKRWSALTFPQTFP